MSSQRTSSPVWRGAFRSQFSSGDLSLTALGRKFCWVALQDLNVDVQAQRPNSVTSPFRRGTTVCEQIIRILTVFEVSIMSKVETEAQSHCEFFSKLNVFWQNGKLKLKVELNSQSHHRHAIRKCIFKYICVCVCVGRSQHYKSKQLWLFSFYPHHLGLTVFYAVGALVVKF